MSDSVLQTQIDAARAYESLFVPALFGQRTEVMAAAVQLQYGQSVLDVACGTGSLAAQVSAGVGPNGYVAGLDPNRGMLAVAKETMPNIDWREGWAESLPFSDSIFDAVASQFGLMFFRERTQSIQEMLRVLKPSGTLAIAVWDAIENIPGYYHELQLIEQFGGFEAGAAVRAPFTLGNTDDLMTLFQKAGANASQVQTHGGKARFPNIRTMVEAELRGWLTVMDVHLSEDVIETILREAEITLAPFEEADGTVVFDITAHIIIGKKH